MNKGAEKLHDQLRSANRTVPNLAIILAFSTLPEQLIRPLKGKLHKCTFYLRNLTVDYGQSIALPGLRSENGSAPFDDPLAQGR